MARYAAPFAALILRGGGLRVHFSTTIADTVLAYSRKSRRPTAASLQPSSFALLEPNCRGKPRVKSFPSCSRLAGALPPPQEEGADDVAD